MQDAARDTALRQADRRAAVAIFLFVLLPYVWFFQGSVRAQHAHFSTIRQLVERHTFEITPLRSATGDIAVVDSRIYSNKPPGIALLGALVYAPLLAAERVLGFSSNNPHIDSLNQAVLTAILCSLPGAGIAAMMFTWIRRREAPLPLAATLALAFAFGSIVFPFSGMIYNHVAVAAALLAAWLLLNDNKLGGRRVFAVSSLFFLAAISDYLAGMVAGIFIIADFFSHRSVHRAGLLAVGPVCAMLVLLWYQHVVFGNAFSPSYLHEEAATRYVQIEPPKFHSPQWQRLYWLTWGRMRGLFYCSPIFLLPLFGLLRRWRPPDRDGAVALAVVVFYTVFLLTYRYWLGGNGVGPRFFIPALPMLFIFSAAPAARFRLIAVLLIVLSCVNMFAVTAVNADFPGNEAGNPQHWDPVGVCLLRLINNQLAVTENSYNLGQVFGLRGVWSVVPVMAIIAGAFFWAVRLREPPSVRFHSDANNA